MRPRAVLFDRENTLVASRTFSFPQTPGAKTLFISLKRRALAPLAWLTRLRRAGAVAPAGPLRGPVPLISRSPSAAGFLFGRAAARPGPAHLPQPVSCGAFLFGRIADAGPLRGPVPLIFRSPCAAGRSFSAGSPL